MPTILVVDDNAITRKVVRVTLAAEGYQVREAEDGAAAVAEVTRQPPDLILQDLVLPDGSGIDLVARLRALPGAADIPILAFSGFQPATSKARSLAAGFTDYLFKPVQPSVLVQTVAAYLKVDKPASFQSPARPRVLVADDDPIQLKLTALQLTGVGFEVRAVADAEAVLQAARRDPPDLIVSDILMPGLDGFRLCLAVRADARLAHIPVVLHTSAFTEAADRAFALSVGAADFVLRSPDGQELLAAVSRGLGALPGPLPQAPAPLEIDEYTQRLICQLDRLASTNVRLSSRVGWLETERAILGGLAEVLKGTPVVDSLVDEVLYRFVDAAGISCGLAYLVEPDGALAPRSRIGLAEVTEEEIRTFFGQSALLREVVSRGAAIIIPSERVPAVGARAVLAGLGMESAIVVPLGAGHEQLGVIALASEHHRFDEEWRAFAEAVGVVIGQSIGLARTVVQLRESEERSRRIVDAVPSGVLIADRTGRFTDANAAAEQILGVAREVIITRRFNDPSWRIAAVDGSPSDGLGTAARDTILRGEPLRGVEMSVVPPDGSSRVAISVNAEALRDATTSHIGTVFAVTDITARKLADAELRRRGRQQETVARFGQFALEAPGVDELLDAAVAATAETLEAPRVGLYELLPDGLRLRLAAATGALAKFTQASLTVEVDLSSQVGFTAINGGPVVAEDLSHETRFGVPGWIRDLGLVSSISVLVPGQPAPFGVLIAHSLEQRLFSDDDAHFFQAIAHTLAAAIARLRSEAAVRESEARYRRIVETTSEGIWTIDVYDRTTYVNQRLADMLGYRVDEMMGVSLYQFMTDETAAIARASVKRRREAIDEQLEFSFRRKDGSAVQAWLNTNPLLADDGTYEGSLAVVTDVTARKNLEAQFRQAQKMEAIGQLAGGVAHDFNNLLTVINGYSELLVERTELTDRQREAIAQIMQAGVSAAALTRQLLAFSRQQVIAPKDLDLNVTVEQLSRMLLRLIGEDVTFSVVLAPSLGTIRADPGQIEQILLNLASNARDAMPRGGRLTIETANVEIDVVYASGRADAQYGPHVVLSVSDSGVGMDAALQARIFEPFFTTKEVGKGTGLGLAAVHGIVKQNGGSIGVYSEVGVGTTFKVYFPRVATQASRDEAVVASDRGPGGSETILVAEDDARLRALSRTALEGSGYTILEASDGEDALLVAGRHVGPIHLLLTDVVMPRLDGRLLAERLALLHPAMKVIFVSGYTDDIVVRHGVVNATVEFLQKPFTLRALNQKVRQVLDAP